MTHTLQVQGFEKDRAVVQLAINKLEDDLAVARQAQDSLEEQKQANVSCHHLWFPLTLR